MVFAAFLAVAGVVIGITMYVFDLVNAPVAIQRNDERRAGRQGERIELVRRRSQERLKEVRTDTARIANRIASSAEKDAVRGVTLLMFHELQAEAEAILEEARRELAAGIVTVEASVSDLRVRIVAVQCAAIISFSKLAPESMSNVRAVPESVPKERDAIIGHASQLANALSSDDMTFRASGN